MPRLPLRLISIVAFLLLWAGLAALADSNEVPGPLAVLGFLVREAAAGELVYHLAATLARVAAAFTIAMAVGTAVGVLMGQHRRLDRLLDPWIIRSEEHTSELPSLMRTSYAVSCFKK